MNKDELEYALGCLVLYAKVGLFLSIIFMIWTIISMFI